MSNGSDVFENDSCGDSLALPPGAILVKKQVEDILIISKDPYGEQDQGAVTTRGRVIFDMKYDAILSISNHRFVAVPYASLDDCTLIIDVYDPSLVHPYYSIEYSLAALDLYTTTAALCYPYFLSDERIDEAYGSTSSSLFLKGLRRAVHLELEDAYSFFIQAMNKLEDSKESEDSKKSILNASSLNAEKVMALKKNGK